MGWTMYQANFYKNGKINRKAEVLELCKQSKSNLLKLVSKGTKYYALFETQSKKMWCCLFLTRTSNGNEFWYKDIELNPLEIGGIPNSILNSFVPSTEEDKKWLQENLLANEKLKQNAKRLKLGDIVKCISDRNIYFGNGYEIKKNEEFYIYFHKDNGKKMYQLVRPDIYYNKIGFSLMPYKITSKWFSCNALQIEKIKNVL